MKYKELSKIADQYGFRTRVMPNSVVIINRSSDVKALIDRDNFGSYTICSSTDNFVPEKLAGAIAVYADTLWIQRDEPDYDLNFWEGKIEKE